MPNLSAFSQDNFFKKFSVYVVSSSSPPISSSVHSTLAFTSTTLLKRSPSKSPPVAKHTKHFKVLPYLTSQWHSTKLVSFILLTVLHFLASITPRCPHFIPVILRTSLLYCSLGPSSLSYIYYYNISLDDLNQILTLKVIYVLTTWKFTLYLKLLLWTSDSFVQLHIWHL